MRKRTRKVRIGDLEIGGNAPVAVQSMTNTPTSDTSATIEQINNLVKAGCDIVRVAIPDKESVESFKKIKNHLPDVPLVADIHFDYRLALKAIEYGADKIRINPGNIGGGEQLEKVTSRAAKAGIPIRIGINSGSLESDILEKYKHSKSDALVASALRNISLCESFGFRNIVISLKSSDILCTIHAYRKISRLVEYPLHVGVTEAGTYLSATVKSSIAIGTLLLEGIGDTIRISITGDPVDEVRVGWKILQSIGLGKRGLEIISCPTCSRAQIDLINLVKSVEEKTFHIKEPLKVAIMGCAVNGPGEAREADIGIAGGNKSALLFQKGKIIRKIPENQIVDTLVEFISNLKGKK